MPGETRDSGEAWEAEDYVEFHVAEDALCIHCYLVQWLGGIGLCRVPGKGGGVMPPLLPGSVGLRISCEESCH